MSFSNFGQSNVTPLCIGRGRGFFNTPVQFSLGDQTLGSPLLDVHTVNDSLVTGETVTPSGQTCPTIQPPQCSSTSIQDSHVNNAGLVDQMSTIVQQIGQQLADSVMAHLNSSSPSRTVIKTTQNESHQVPCSSLDLSQVQLVSRSQVKEPSIFKGESSDTVTVDEWEDSMKNYIKKSGVQQEHQAEEILIHLRGRARDVVRCGIRNCGIDVQRNPQAIYSLLRKHFGSDQCSPVPLADFYSTRPRENEDPFEYWLRLNGAADVAVNLLKEQGKTFDNPSVEVTRMFIRNCPCKDLAFTFRSKTIEKWSAQDVQEVLDEYHMEKGLRSAEKETKISVNRAEVDCTAPISVHKQELQQCVAPDNSTMERLIGMLEKVLL
ncbi:PREDICTED: uncharacterized protein LOC106930616 [Poecilia mexicana]|uniref:uncharacterized protein LOC106930616 n=1 Tax=Poecilia mexicana TaxID=48701 RepID=UPI00072DCBC0|nr:PREDICTED: uncharacterized protein LOC106930616 [Poecilia mexicana]XP_014863752.1 PREDICTED: uncharacterized protein LOC106930616 [Poecilia mexicana]